MIGQIPSNMLLTRIRPGLYLSGCAFIWSCLSAATAGVTNLQTLLVVRFFLGLAEAPFFPGAVFCLSSWYTRGEIARRITCPLDLPQPIQRPKRIGHPIATLENRGHSEKHPVSSYRIRAGHVRTAGRLEQER